MRKLLAALLVASLCLAVPAVAWDWGDLPFDGMAMVDTPYPPGEIYDNNYFDVYVSEFDGDNGNVYPGWCVETGEYSIKEWYCAKFTTTIGVDETWNKVNWVLNNKGDATFGEIQWAIWTILGEAVPSQYSDWGTETAKKLVENANPSYIPGCDEIAGVLVTPTCVTGQSLIIEVDTEPCPPVPEFPLMTIPVFFVGGVLVAASVLKKE